MANRSTYRCVAGLDTGGVASLLAAIVSIFLGVGPCPTTCGGDFARRATCSSTQPQVGLALPPLCITRLRCIPSRSRALVRRLVRLRLLVCRSGAPLAKLPLPSDVSVHGLEALAALVTPLWVSFVGHPHACVSLRIACSSLFDGAQPSVSRAKPQSRRRPSTSSPAPRDGVELDRPPSCGRPRRW